MPTVSAIITTYNLEKMLPEAIESVLAQDWKDLEIIVVDDGSSDDTAAVMERYSGVVRYILQKNAGPSAARNTGVQVSSGKFLAFLDGDDLWKPNKVSRQLEEFEKDSTVGLVSSDFSVDEGAKVTESYLVGCQHVASGMIFLNLLRENFLLPSAAMLRRECVTQVGAWDEAIRGSEDRDYWLRVARTWRINVIPEVLTVKRNRPGNLTSDNDKLTPHRIRVFEKVLANDELTSVERHTARAALSDNYWDLGYMHWKNGRREDARSAFWKSLTLRVSKRSLLSLGGTLAPHSVVRFLQRKDGPSSR
jgi:glycosyltransferase involved in cell wall biosynthesis